MKERVESAVGSFNQYVSSFKDLSEEHQINFDIKREHSVRVAEMAASIADGLNLNQEEISLAYITGLFHDIGRFPQLIEYNTFHDEKSVNHAELSVKVVEDEGFLNMLEQKQVDLIKLAILLHNQKDLPGKLSEKELLFSQILRDADKLDILKVLTDYYSDRNSKPNHTLTWELPKGNTVSPKVSKEVLAGKLVTKKNVESEVDVKVMQLAWVYDINFKPSFRMLQKNRFLEKIFNSLPKNDLNFEIYRNVKVFTENKLLN